MRTRSVHIRNSTTLDCGVPGGKDEDILRIPYYSSESLYPWGGSYGPYCSYISDIADALSPSHARRRFQTCTHSKYKAAWIEGSKTISFPDETAPVSVKVSHPFMFSPSLSTPDGPWDTMADELASLADGNTDHSSMLAVTLLETAKTIEMLRNPFNLLKPNFRRKVRKLTARTLSNRGAGIWLEGYYGWKSLYQDFETIAKATAYFLSEPATNAFEKLGERLSVQKKAGDVSMSVAYALGTTEYTWTQASNNGFYYNDGRPVKGHMARLVNYHHGTTYSLGCRQFMDAQARIAGTRRFLQASGLTSWRSIRDTIWEVIPFSFVVDWFVDTRSVWAPLNKWRLGEMDIKELGYSTKLAGEYDVDLYIDPWLLYYGYPDWGGVTPNLQSEPVIRSSSRGSFSLYERYAGFPPSYVVDAHFLGKGLSFIRGINGAALITQLASKRKPRR